VEHSMQPGGQGFTLIHMCTLQSDFCYLTITTGMPL